MAEMNGFVKAIKNQDSLATFLKKMGEFDKKFCDLMASQEDFNIRLEIRGNAGKIIHCRLAMDSTDRPEGD